MNISRKHSLRTSGKIAKARTKVTIAADRLDCSPDDLQQMQKELVNILTKYMDMDDDILKIRMDIIYGTNRGEQDVKTIQIK